MKKHQTNGFDTVLYLTVDEARDICNLGNPKKQCPFIIPHLSEFKCIRMDYTSKGNNNIIKKLIQDKKKLSEKSCDWYMVAATARDI